jgi:3'(2'), 5'-bisphosphate nucleotidase
MHAERMDELREGIIALAREAAGAILRVYEGEFDVQRKDDDSPLTAADLASHRCIVDGLERLAPDIPVLSEESAQDVPAGLRRQWPCMWLVDPLDGTREFVKRNGEFTVNIALIDRDVPVRTRTPATPPLRVAASRSHRDARTEAVLARMGEIEAIGVGSSLKFCRLAEGTMDVYPRFGPTSEWDTAAGQCVLEAAGGAVLDPKGRPLRYNQRDTILNGDFIALGDPSLPWRGWLA